MSTAPAPGVSKATKASDYLPVLLLMGSLFGLIGLVLGVVRLLNPDPLVLATLPLEGSVARASIQLTEPGELRVLLNVKAHREMDRGDLGDDLTRSQLTLTGSNPEATARCSAFDGWSGSGSEEKRKRVVLAAHWVRSH